MPTQTQKPQTTAPRTAPNSKSSDERAPKLTSGGTDTSKPVVFKDYASI